MTSDSESDISPIPASAVLFRHPHFVKGDIELRICEGYPDRGTVTYETSYLTDALFSGQQTTQSTDLQNHTVSIDGTNVWVDTQPPSWTVPVWMAIDVPSQTPAGEYSGTVTVSAVSGETTTAMTTLQVSIQVAPWTMPDAADRQFHLDLWQFPVSVLDRYNDANSGDRIEIWSEEHYALLEPTYRYLAGLGQRTVTTYIKEGAVGAPSMIQWTLKSDGAWKYDYSVFDAYVTRLVSWGIDQQISAFSPVGWNPEDIPYWDEAAQSKKTFSADVGSSDWNTRWSHFLTDFRAHLVEKGWLDKTVLYLDETPEAHTEAVIDLVGTIDENWKIGLAYSHAPGAHIVSELYDSSNILLPAGLRYADDGLTTGTIYRYAVQACNTADCGELSDGIHDDSANSCGTGCPDGFDCGSDRRWGDSVELDSSGHEWQQPPDRL